MYNTDELLNRYKIFHKRNISFRIFKLDTNKKN